MGNDQRGSLLGDLVCGAIAGAAATWMMDLVTTGMLQQQPADATERENEARPNGQSSLANLVDRIDSAAGLELDAGTKSSASQLAHYALGVVPGALYAAVRRRLPLVGSLRGLIYGATLWAVNDEYVNARLGLSAPWSAYPTETHVRGLVGHLVLGASTDTVLDVLRR
jgi:uncharacterized membrane protein YagU involved in acid resistance